MSSVTGKIHETKAKPSRKAATSAPMDPMETEDIEILYCLVEGDDPDDNAFPVKIDRNESVGELKKAIKHEKAPEFDNIATDKLQLWQVDTPFTAAGQITTAELAKDKKLSAVKKVVDYWDPRPPEYRIHVIIARPPAHNLKRSFEEALMEKLEKLENLPEIIKKTLRDEKRSVISISKVDDSHYEELIRALKLSRRIININVRETKKTIKPFNWNNYPEQQQADRYLNWLKNNITLPDEVLFYNSKSENILSTSLESLPFDITGTVDVAIVDQRYVDGDFAAGGIRAAIELKKSVAKADTKQAIVELIAASVYSEYAVVIVLTDLKNVWRFFWLQKDEIVSCNVNLKDAKTLLEDIVSGAPKISTGKFRHAANAPYNERLTFKQVIMGGTAPESQKGLELQQLLEGSKVDLMQLLPEDDIAQMQDVFDVMSPEEVLNWKQRRLLNYLQKTPVLQSSLST